jgi:exodeoxyribonuclease VII small subunit
MGKTAEEKFNYEKSLKKLEDIVAKLEDENTPLEKAIELFTEGKKLSDLCLKKLTELEKRVQVLMEDENGEASAKDFASEDSESEFNTKE